MEKTLHTRVSKLVAKGKGWMSITVDITPTELDRLYQSDLITRDQHGAGETLLSDLWAARMLGSRAGNLLPTSPTQGPPQISRRQSDAMRSVSRAIDAVDSGAGRDARLLLLSVLTQDRTVSSPAAIVTMRQALTALLLHYDRTRTGRVNPALDLAARLFAG